MTSAFDSSPPPPSYPPSIYAEDVVWPQPSPPPDGDQDVEIAVVGGGLTGVSLALALAEQGRSVHLYEAQRIGYGASGRNGGQICQGWTTDLNTLMAKLPPSMRNPSLRNMVWQVGMAGRQIIIDRCKKHNIDAELKFGYLHAALHQRHMTELDAMQKEWEDEGYQALERLPDAMSLKHHVNTDAYIGGLYDHQSGHFHPLKYLLGLAEAARKAGAVIHENCPISEGGLNEKKGAKNRARLKHPKGTIRAETLILAGNAYLASHLGASTPRPMQSRLAPVISGIIATEPLEAGLADELLPKPIAVADCNTALNYYRLDARGRMLFGGRAAYIPIDDADVEGYLKRKMTAVFPALKNVPIARAWSGRIGITVARIPHFGRLGEGVFFVQGFSGHGVALSGIAAEIIAEAVQGDSRRFDTFAAIRHLPFPGGALRTPVLALGMAYYKFKDWLKI